MESWFIGGSPISSDKSFFSPTVFGFGADADEATSSEDDFFYPVESGMDDDERQRAQSFDIDRDALAEGAAPLSTAPNGACLSVRKPRTHRCSRRRRAPPRG